MNKLSIRSLLTCIATIVALLAISVAPALADHKGETHGQQAEDENFQEADNSASEEDTSTTKESGKPSEEEETSSSSSESTTTEGDSSRSSSGSSFTRNTQREPEPDPEPSQAPPATKGPNACPDYSGSQGGPYDHDNCDVSQGQHGGGGNDKCAGCTGKADDKGPGGQHPGDHNNGYECDHNSGVGKGNPAHSRCPKAPPLCPAGTDLFGLPIPPDGCNLQRSQLCPPGTDLAGLPVPSTGCDVGENELCPPGSDMAGRPPGPNGCNQVLGRIDKVCPEDSELAGRDMVDLKDCVLGTRFQNSTPPGDEPLGAILPFTGSGGVSMFILIGLLLMGAGLASLRFRKSA